MNQAALAPAVLAPAPPQQDFAAESDRARLTRVGLTAYRSLAARWSLTNAEAAALLGVSASSWDRIKRPDPQRTRNAPPLGQDQMTRISALVGTYKALHLLFAPDLPLGEEPGEDMADRWPRLPNAGALFAGQTPIAAMIAGGIPRMIDVRRLVDAVRGGL